eukprot:symbB.v1.2.023520.t1/scaffold2155.1/size87741/1
MVSVETVAVQDLPLPPGDPPTSFETPSDDMVRSRGTLHGYDSSTTRAPFAYGLIRGEDNEFHFFVRAHLERGVIAELLQPGAPLEFFSQKFEPGDVRWAYGVRKVPSKLGSRWAARKTFPAARTSPERPKKRRWVTLLDGISNEVQVSKLEDKVKPPEIVQEATSSTVPLVPASSRRWVALITDSTVTVEPQNREPSEAAASSEESLPGDGEELAEFSQVSLEILLQQLLQAKYGPDIWKKSLELFYGCPIGAFLDNELEKVNAAIKRCAMTLGLDPYPQVSWREIIMK